MKHKTMLFKKKSTKVEPDNLTISKKEFRDSPAVEKFYKTVNEFKLRKETYKAAIKIFLNIKK